MKSQWILLSIYEDSQYFRWRGNVPSSSGDRVTPDPIVASSPDALLELEPIFYICMMIIYRGKVYRYKYQQYDQCIMYHVSCIMYHVISDFTVVFPETLQKYK